MVGKLQIGGVVSGCCQWREEQKGEKKDLGTKHNAPDWCKREGE